YDPVENKVYTVGSEWKTFVAKPTNSHGTYVSSTIVATKGNGKGIVGLAHDAKVLPVAIFNSAYVGDFAVSRGIVWSVNNGARVLNNSWGGGVSDGILKKAFDYALGQNVVVVASAGNTYRDERQKPGALPGVIASGASNAYKQRHTFSTQGRQVSTIAPGYDIMLAAPTWTNNSTNNLYALISGTSFSAPYTSAVAALILQKCPTATPYQVKRLMEETADGSVGSNPAGYDRDTGWGHIDLAALTARLTSCSNLPAKGATAIVNVQYLASSSYQTGLTANVNLRGKGYVDGSTNDPTPQYEATTDETGAAVFPEIAPGTYDIYVGGSDRWLTSGPVSERDTYVGTIVATAGSNASSPDRMTVVVNSDLVTNPVDPYEQNDRTDEAKVIAYGQTSLTAYIHGQSRDFDWFRFTGVAGDRVRINVDGGWTTTLGGTLNSHVQLIAADGTTVLAQNDDISTVAPINRDSEITSFLLPASGTYFIRVTSSAIAGSATATDNSIYNRYRLRLTTVDQYEPNDTTADAKTIAYGDTSSIAYIHGQPRDFDWFKFSGVTGDQVRVNVDASASALGGTLNSHVQLVGTNGTTVHAFNDNISGSNTDSQITTFTLPADGTYFIRVTSSSIAANATNTNDNANNRYQVRLAKLN
ncbi:MAG TPA: S8 family serine peptidase, partial [Deinococcales bacterium]|nr:S8 family serine peptidase [Deinococcales bacterium]